MSAGRVCDLCQGRSHRPLYEVNGFSIVRCASCGLVFVDPAPRPEALIALYDEGYWEDPAKVGYDGYRAAELRKRHHYRGLLRQIEAIVPPGEMIEIGSAYGYFLDEARARGWRVRGVEPSTHAAQQARDQFGLEIFVAPFTELPFEPDSCDAIVLWDVIEHLPNPRETVERASACLRAGGALAISTGDIRSLSARLHGADWSLLTPPWHQYYFSKKTIQRMLEHASLELVKIGGDGTVALDPASQRPRIRGLLGAALQTRVVTTAARKLGAGMILFALARKAPR
jgi:SAM-dependent methyltransferase